MTSIAGLWPTRKSRRIICFWENPIKRSLHLSRQTTSSKRAPVRWTWLAGGGWAYLQAGNYEEAINWLRRALAERPRAHRARVWLIAAYALSGRQQDAATELAELQRAQPELFSQDDALAQMINTPGSPAFGEYMRRVVEGLEKGGFPERMTKPLLAKSLVPVGSKNSAEGNASQ